MAAMADIVDGLLRTLLLALAMRGTRRIRIKRWIHVVLLFSINLFFVTREVEVGRVRARVLRGVNRSWLSQTRARSGRAASEWGRVAERVCAMSKGEAIPR